MTVNGSGYAKSWMKSIRPRGRSPSSSVSAVCWMRARSASTWAAAKVRVASARIRVWSGGSAARIWVRMILLNGSASTAATDGNFASRSSPMPNRLSDSTRFTWSCRVSTQHQPPGDQCTGSSARIR